LFPRSELQESSPSVCLFNKAAQKCGCFSLLKFCLEISLSLWVCLNSALIISLLLEQLHPECTDIEAAFRRFSRSRFGWGGIPGNLIAFVCQSPVAGKSSLLSSSGSHQALAFNACGSVMSASENLSSQKSIFVLLTGIKWEVSVADV